MMQAIASRYREAALERTKRRTVSLIEPFWQGIAKGNPGYIYLMRMHTDANAYLCPFKIGRSIDPHVRLKQVAAQFKKYPISLTSYFAADDADYAELQLHVWYADERVDDEWFALSPAQLEYLIGLERYAHSEFQSFDWYELGFLPERFWDGTNPNTTRQRLQRQVAHMRQIDGLPVDDLTDDLPF